MMLVQPPRSPRRSRRMSFTLLFCALTLLGGASRGAAGADDDEPVVANKKLSQWLEVLQDKNSPLKQRKASLIVMGMYAGKYPGLIPGLVRALQKDDDE